MVVDGILLDHDMPHRDGREWARWLVEEGLFREEGGLYAPVIITSTTGLEGVREEMLETLRKGGFKAIINPADHIGCETEWLSWMKGALA
jgi:CheY-like chemotaxis protein